MSSTKPRPIFAIWKPLYILYSGNTEVKVSFCAKERSGQHTTVKGSNRRGREGLHREDDTRQRKKRVSQIRRPKRDKLVIEEQRLGAALFFGFSSPLKTVTGSSWTARIGDGPQWWDDGVSDLQSNSIKIKSHSFRLGRVGFVSRREMFGKTCYQKMNSTVFSSANSWVHISFWFGSDFI